MCSGILEVTEVSGSGKGPQGWFPVTQANVSFDHPNYATIPEAVIIDFVNPAQGASARVAVEISAESARGLIKAILAALETGEAMNIAGAAAH